jgi:SAM-dependent methyltransferase
MFSISPELALSTIDDLKRAYDRSAAYLDAVGDSRSPDARPDLSTFWREHLDARPGQPTFDDMLVFRRRGFTYGVGEVSTTDDPAAEARFARATTAVVKASAPDLRISEYPEPPIGCPHVFDVGGVLRSGSAVINALTSERIVAEARRAGIDRRPLAVLEVGAGYGQGPQQLFAHLPIRSYAVCDLPENLFLSSFFLQAALPDKPCAFVEPGRDPASPDGLVFCIPPALENLPGPFDVVVNAYSFQEMNLESVRGYFEAIAERLAPDGIFYSLNAHGKAGVRRPSDYPLDLFQVQSLRPVRRLPFLFFATEPYELVLRPRREGSSTADPHAFDALGGLLQLGFHDELAPVCDRWAAARLTDADVVWVSAARSFVWSESSEAKRAALERLSEAAPRGVADLAAAVLETIEGTWAAAGNAARRAADSLAVSSARIRALTIAAAAGDASALEEAVHDAAHMEDELRSLARNRAALAAGMTRLVRLAEGQKLRSRLRRRIVSGGARPEA